MKLSSGGDSDIMSMPVDALLMNPWNNEDFTPSNFLIDEDGKLSLGGDGEDDLNDHKPLMDDLDLLLTATTNNVNATSIGINNSNSLAELKPLPPFTGYTGHLSINGISGHHYHAIASSAPNNTNNNTNNNNHNHNNQRILIENNNNCVETTNQNNIGGGYYPSTTDHVVSSSTIDSTIDSIKSESNHHHNIMMGYNNLENVNMDDDLAAIIGSAMADTTVSCNVNDVNRNTEWLEEFDWIDVACGAAATTSSSKITSPDNNHNNIQDFVASSQFSITPSPPHSRVSFHTAIKSSPHGGGGVNTSSSSFPHNMPLLQNRLQNGPPKDDQIAVYNIVSECTSPSSSTPYLAHSPPCHVVSTSDIAFIQANSTSRPSPELRIDFPHTTTPSKKSRSRSSKSAKSSLTSSSSNTIIYTADGGASGVLGKEKTVHRCNICNRGFLNKSNIKVHLRTHTGEKPFRCEVCGKAFRQKAHLIKHAQIHKRIGRD